MARLHTAVHVFEDVDAAVAHEVAPLAGPHAHAAYVVVVRHRRVPEGALPRRWRLLRRVPWNRQKRAQRQPSC